MGDGKIRATASGKDSGLYVSDCMSRQQQPDVVAAKEMQFSFSLSDCVTFRVTLWSQEGSNSQSA